MLQKNTIDKRRYRIMGSVEANESDKIGIEEINVHIDWGGQSRTPVCSYPE